jgi:hypothetical protein
LQSQLIKIIIILGGVWVLLDEIYGKKNLEKFIKMVVG